MIVYCTQCKAEIDKKPSQVARAILHFCSRKCHSDYQRVYPSKQAKWRAAGTRVKARKDASPEYRRHKLAINRRTQKKFQSDPRNKRWDLLRRKLARRGMIPSRREEGDGI